MKKSFTLFTIFALFLMLLFPVSVKAADIVRYFGYQDNQWTSSSGSETSCAGTITNADKIITGSDFYYSGRHDEAFKRCDNDWTGANGAGNYAGVRACTRSNVSLAVGTYTFKLLSKNTENATLTLPKITVGGAEYSVSDVLNHSGESQSFSSENNQFAYTSGNEFTLCYTVTISGSAYNGNVSIEFKDGWKEKYLFKSLTITPNATQYTVSATASNGSVSGTGSYAEGAEVTLTASPNDNYSFTSWSSSDISIANASANPLVFTMPNKAVSITANFTECTKHTVTLADDGHGSTSGGGEQCDGSVTVTATPNSGYRFVNWTNTSTSDVVSTDAEYTFTLSTDISLTANFEVDPCLSSLTVEVEDNYASSSDYSGVNYPSSMVFVERNPSGSNYASSCHGRGYVNYQGSGGNELLIPVNIPVIGSYKVKAYAGVNKDMYINIYATTATDQGSITYKSTTYYKQKYKKINESNGSETFVESEYTDAVELPTGVCLIGLYGGWSHSAWDQITITRTDGTAFCPNTITMAKSGDDGAAAPTASPANAAMAGTEVTITAGEASANHYFSGWTVSPENAVTFADPANATTTFVMPEADVTITANYGAVVSSEFTYTTSGSGSITCATASGSSVVSGTAISMTAVPSTDYVFTGWTASAGSFSDASALTTNFTMPASAATVTANFAQVDNVITVGSESGSSADIAGGGASITESNISDFDAFAHNVIKLAYSNMSGSDKWYGWNLGKQGSYNFANSAGATGFGFYYKTESTTDAVALWFDPNHGDKDENQHGMQLPATNNVWKYVYFAHADANSWNKSYMRIFINGAKEGKSTANASGAIYLANIAATSVTSRPDINTYQYTNNRGGNMAVDDYGTLCLPMAGTIAGATLYSIAGKEGTTYVVLKEEDALAAGQPYITQSTATSYTVTMSGVHSAAAENVNGLTGTYVEMNLAENTNHYILSANKLMQVGSGGVTMGAYRAYLDLSQVSEYNPSSSAPGRYVRMAIDETGAATGIESVEHSAIGSQKILRNGQIFILRNGVEYNVNGQMTK